MASFRIANRICIFVLLQVNLYVAGQELIETIPVECNIPVAESYCAKATNTSGISICGAYKHPWPICPSFCFDILVQLYYVKSCPGRIPSFVLARKLRDSCTKVCYKIESGDEYFWEDKRLGFLVYLNASSLTGDAKISTDTKYYKLTGGELKAAEKEGEKAPSLEPSPSVSPTPTLPAPISVGAAPGSCSSYACYQCQVLSHMSERMYL